MGGEGLLPIKGREGFALKLALRGKGAAVRGARSS